MMRYDYKIFNKNFTSTFFNTLYVPFYARAKSDPLLNREIQVIRGQDIERPGGNGSIFRVKEKVPTSPRQIRFTSDFKISLKVTEMDKNQDVGGE